MIFLAICITLISFLFQLSQAHLDAVDLTLVDLTFPMNNQTLDWSSIPFQLNFTQDLIKINNSYEYWYQIDNISTSTHCGTHLDAPCHFARNHWCVSDIPLSRLFQRPAYLIDISSKCLNNLNCELTLNDLTCWIEKNGKMKNGGVLLVRTGLSRFWNDKNKYFGINLKKSLDFQFPGIHPEVAKYLTTKMNIFGVGIESPSVDYGPSKTFETHTILAASNIYTLENLGSNIDKLPAKGFLISAIPIKIDGASGSPVRIIAQLSLVNKNNQEWFLILIAIFVIIVINVKCYYGSK